MALRCISNTVLGSTTTSLRQAFIYFANAEDSSALPLPRLALPCFTPATRHQTLPSLHFALPCLCFDTQRYANTEHNSTMPGSTKTMQRDSEAMLANAST
jgi:hypothetical protein